MKMAVEGEIRFREKNKPFPVITCYPTDPRAEKLGGIETGLNGYVFKSGGSAAIKFVGVDAVGDLKLRSWNRVVWKSRAFDFFPLFAQKDLNRATFPPLNLRFIYHLWKNKAGILERPAVINFHRVDHLFPFWADPRFPIVLTIHGTSKNIHLPNESWVGKIRPLFLLAERISLLRADKIFCVSEEGVRYYRNRLAGHSEKVEWIAESCSACPRTKKFCCSSGGWRKLKTLTCFCKPCAR
jgi:hypothetical protein